MMLKLEKEKRRFIPSYRAEKIVSRIQRINSERYRMNPNSDLWENWYNAALYLARFLIAHYHDPAYQLLSWRDEEVNPPRTYFGKPLPRVLCGWPIDELGYCSSPECDESYNDATEFCTRVVMRGR